MTPEAQQILKENWAVVKDGVIDVPDEFMPLLNKIGMQIRFHTISNKGELETICRIIQLAEEFFTNVKYKR